MAVVAMAVVVGALVGAMLSTSRTGEDQDSMRPGVGDGRIQGAMNGNIISILYGQQTLAGNFIWQGALTEHKHEESQNVGGKGGGGGGDVTITTYSLSGSFAIGLCEGPIALDALKKVWANDELIVDTSIPPTNLTENDIRFEVLDGGLYGSDTYFIRSTITNFVSEQCYVGQVITITGSGANNKTLTIASLSTNEIRTVTVLTNEAAGANVTMTGLGNTGLQAGNILFYTGEETQIPSSVMESEEGVGNVPPYRGLVYIVFEEMSLRPYGDQYPQIMVELEGV